MNVMEKIPSENFNKLLFDFLGPNYGLFKKIEPEFGQNFRHDHKWPSTKRS
jgi:hypothetical protein